MKMLTCIIFAASMAVSAKPLAQTVTISGKSILLKDIFAELKKQTGYVVFFNKSFLKNAKPVTVNVAALPVREFMLAVLKDQPFSFQIEGKTISLIPLPEQKPKPGGWDHSLKILSDTTMPIQGTITNDEGLKLAGVNIMVAGTNKGVISDANGRYVIAAKQNDKLVFTYVGYNTAEHRVNGKAPVNIQMTKAMQEMQEVVVNKGYYQERRKYSTGSIARVEAKDIERQPVGNFLSTIQGRMAGVNISQQSGLPGAGINIEIRGRSSISNTGYQPLYVVDGMPYVSEFFNNPSISNPLLDAGFNTTGPNVGVNPISTINPADIESIEVLKDADATSIYGSRGANGVVLITTKKGKAGKTELSVNAFTGASKVTRLADQISVKDYIMVRKEMNENDGRPTGATDYDINGAWDENKSTNWQEFFLGGTSKTNQLQASVSGGNRQTQFLLGGTIFNETTIYPGDYKYNRGNIHLKLSHLSDNNKLRIDVSANYVADKNNLPGLDLSNFTRSLAPNNPDLRKADGSVNWSTQFTNPLGELQRKYKLLTNGLHSSATFSYKLLNNLDFKTTLGYSDFRITESSTSPHTMYNPASGFTSANSSLYVSNVKNQTWNIEPVLSYDKDLGKGKLNVLIGSTFLSTASSMLGQLGRGFSSNNLITNLGAAATVFGLPSNNKEYRYNAIFGRINYNWDGKYILNLTARRDGSSRFGEGRQFGNFGSVGAAWLFSREAFVYNSISILSTGKLRGSYGTTGNDKIGDYLHLNTYTNTANDYQGMKGLEPSQLHNPEFSWETNKKLELALELGFLNDRVFFTTAWYRNRSSNQLVGFQLPGTTGFSLIQANLPAVIDNKGWEFELASTNVKKKQFTWNTAINLTIPRNELVAFPGLRGSTYDAYYVIGQPVTILKLYSSLGVDPQTGIFQFYDFNNDGKISRENDRQAIGDLSPRFLGGINNNISWKNFDLSFMFQIVKQKGRHIMAAMPAPGIRGSMSDYILDRWQKPGDIKPVQKYSLSQEAYDAYGRFQSSNGIITDASYIRLKNISLSYNLPAAMLKKANIQVYMLGQNLLTITKFKGADPETQQLHRVPPMKTITAGVRISLK